MIQFNGLKTTGSLLHVERTSKAGVAPTLEIFYVKMGRGGGATR